MFASKALMLFFSGFWGSWELRQKLLEVVVTPPELELHSQELSCCSFGGFNATFAVFLIKSRTNSSIASNL